MSLPNIPDNVYKIFILIGVICICYFFLKGERDTTDYYRKYDLYSASIDTYNLKILAINYEREKLIDAASDLSIRYNVTNPITHTDSTITFKRAIIGDKNTVLVSDSISRWWEQYIAQKYELQVLDKKVEIQKNNIVSIQKEYESSIKIVVLYTILGLLLLAIGINGMNRLQDIQDKILKSQIKDNDEYIHCQSCGKKFTSVLVKGTNADLSECKSFCLNCYANGSFIEPDLTKKEFDERCLHEINNRKSWIEKRQLKNLFKKLERWSEEQYL